MPTLHLGVEDVPYPEEPQGRNRKGQFRRVHRRNMTTGRLADILESKYGIIEAFSEMYGGEIAVVFKDDMELQLGELFEGKRGRGYVRASKKIEKLFLNFIYNKELDGVVEGVPTKASLAGKSYRPSQRKFPKGQARPSFVDTGLYSSHMRAWVD